MSSVISRGYKDTSIDDGWKEENDMTMNESDTTFTFIFVKKKKKKLPIDSLLHKLLCSQ